MRFPTSRGIRLLLLTIGLSGCAESEPATQLGQARHAPTATRLGEVGDATGAAPGSVTITLVQLEATASAESEKPPVPATPIQPADPSVASPAGKEAVHPAAAASPDKTNATPAETPQADPEKKEFQPPFGERSNLFSPPQAGEIPVAPEGGEPSAEPLPAGDVALKGFARVTDLRAILMIEENIAPLAVGQEKYGIRVVEINPPQVTLERSEHRWTISLANQLSGLKASGPQRRPAK